MTMIEDLFDLEIPKDVTVSPNSQQILYSTALPFGHAKGEHSVSTIWLAKTGHKHSSRQLTSGLFNDASPDWSPDGNSIAFVSDRGKKGESSAIYLLPMKSGGEPYPLTPAENERSITKFEFSPDGNFIAYLCADEKTPEKKAKEKEKDDANVWNEDLPYARLRLVHILTKKVATLVSQKAHITDFCWSPDGKKIAVVTTKTPRFESSSLHGNQISILDSAGSKELKEICKFPTAVRELTWTRDTLHFIGHATPESMSSSNAVFSIDLNASTHRFEKCAHGEENCAAKLIRAGQDVVVGVLHGMEDQLRMLNGKTLLSVKKMTTAVHAAFTSDSDELIIAFAASDSNSPTEVFSTTASGGAAIQLSNHGHATDKYDFGSAEFLSCQSHDDEVRLDAAYMTPLSAQNSDEPKKPLPTVVLIHGGPYYRLTDSFDGGFGHFMWPPSLLSKGYGILIPNYRGSSGRGDKFAAYARAGMGTVDYDDVITLTQHAIEKGYADKDKLVVAGWSQGGFLSYLSIVRNGLHGHGWSFKAAIPGAGVADWDTMAFTSDAGATFEVEMAGAVPWVSEKTNVFNRRGSAIWEFQTAMDKGAFIPPVLILHGESDERVPLSQATMFRRALEHYDKPFEFVTYPRQGHLISERKHLIDMLERVLRFVDTHIGGK